MKGDIRSKLELKIAGAYYVLSSFFLASIFFETTLFNTLAGFLVK